MNRSRPTSRRGVLLLDMMVAMAIIGVVALAVVPSVRSEGPLKLVAGSTMLSADIEYALSRTLASPGDPTVVVFEPDGSGYSLALLSEPLTPITDPDGEPWVRTFGVGVASQLDGCTLTRYELPSLPDGGPEVIVFDAFGRLENDGDIAITIDNYAGSQVVHVREATGTVSILATLPDAFVPPEPEPELGDGKDGGLGEGAMVPGPGR